MLAAVRPDLVAADVRRLILNPRNVPVPGRRLHPAKCWFFPPTNQAARFWQCPNTVQRRLPLAPSPPRFSGGEGRGEEALINASNVATRRFNLWFVGSNVKNPGKCRLLRLLLVDVSFIIISSLRPEPDKGRFGRQAGCTGSPAGFAAHCTNPAGPRAHSSTCPPPGGSVNWPVRSAGFARR